MFLPIIRRKLARGFWSCVALLAILVAEQEIP